MGPNGGKIKLEDGIFLPKYSFPTEAEWEYAAFSLIGNSFDERINERRLYPWNGHTKKSMIQIPGKMMANYVTGQTAIYGNCRRLNDNAGNYSSCKIILAK